MLVFLPVASAEPQDAITWKDCVQEAKKNNPDLISASEKVRQAKADKAIEISGALPDISASTSGKSTKAASTGAIADTYAYSVTGEQLVFDGFKTLYDISSSSKTLKAQEYNHAVTSSDIRLNLRRAFAELLKAQELTSLAKEIAGRRKQNLELVELRYQGGREHKGSLLTAEADLANAEYEVRQAERSITLSQRDLSKEMGLERFNPATVKGEFSVREEYDAKPDIEWLADTTPFLRELIARKEAARSDLRSEQVDFFPTVYVNGSIGKSSSKWPPEDEAWSFGATVSLPIFEGGSRFADISKARSKLRQLESDERSGPLLNCVLFDLTGFIVYTL